MPVSEDVSRKIATLSFFAACLVVLIHFPAVPGPGVPVSEAYAFLYWVFPGLLRPAAVPFFFAAAGYLLAGHCRERGWWPRETRKRLRTLVVPYFALNAFYWLVRAGVNLAGAHHRPSAARALDLSWRTPLDVFGILIPDGPENLPLWFVRALFLIVLVSPLVFLPLKRSRGAACAACAAFLLLDAAVFAVPCLWRGAPECWGSLFYYGIPVRGVLFFAIGAAVRLWTPEWRGRALTGVPFLIAGTALTGAASFRNLPFLDAAATLLVVAGLWTLVPARRGPDVLAKGAFPVYALHMLVIHFASVGFRGTAVWRHLFTGYGFFAFWALCVAVPVAAGWLLRYWMPRTARVFFGGR